MASISKTVRPKRSNNSTVSPTGLGLAVGRGTPSASASGGAFDYYIGPSGSDSNTGTLGSPWAITALQTKTATIANKTVGLLDGTYIVAVTTSGGNNSGGIQVSATNLTVKAVNARLAVLTTNNGGSYPQDADPMFQSIGSGITWDGVAFYQSSFDFLRVSGANTTIRNCSFEDVNLGRIAGQPAGDNVGAIFTATSSYPANLLIQNCRFENIYNVSHTENGCAIGPLYYAGATIVEKCSFFDCNVGVGWKSYNHGPLTVRQCYFDSTMGEIAVNGGLGNDYVVPMTFTFTNNVVNRCGYVSDGWNVNTGHSEVISDIRRNTMILEAGAYGICGLAYSNGLTGSVLSGANLHLCTLQDNVVYRESGTDPILYFQAGRNSSVELFGQIDYNMYSTVAMRDANGTTYSTIANWRTRLAASGVTGREANSFVASPTFVNSTGNTAASYALASGSGKNAASDGTDIGAWGGGTTQIGCDFT